MTFEINLILNLKTICCPESEIQRFSYLVRFQPVELVLEKSLRLFTFAGKFGCPRLDLKQAALIAITSVFQILPV